MADPAPITGAPEPVKAAPGAFLTPLFTDRRVAAVLGLGFAQGIPFLLVYATQSAWLVQAKVPLATIGLMSELTIAYKLKFLWAPFLDRHDAPLIGRWLGRRRGWIVATQILVALALAGVAFGDPAHWLAWTVAFSLALGVAGATQDVVIDGWRITAAPPEQQALMSSWAEIGFRIGNLAAGAGALYLSDAYGWRVAYLCMAALMAPGTVAALLAPEPPAPETPATGGFVETVWAPIRDLLARLGPLALPVLALVAGFRMPGYVSNAMAIPLFKTLGYTNTDIATVTKLFGFWIALGGTFLASAIIPRIGMMASLLIGTVTASASHLALAYLAWHGGHGGAAFWTFALTVGIDGFAYAFASIVLITYMSRLSATAHAASQYALLTSLCALPGSLLAGFSGFVIEWTGFAWFFVGTSLIGVPVALLCLLVARRHGPMEPAADAAGDAPNRAT
ncbi:AmpG family muropeptide MFS transporter [Methylobacterium sp. D54C]